MNKESVKKEPKVEPVPEEQSPPKKYEPVVPVMALVSVPEPEQVYHAAELKEMAKVFA